MATVTIKYNSNGGTGTIADQYWDYGQIYLSDGAGFSRAYYTIDGWATTATGSKVYSLGQAWPPSGLSPQGTLTLYAYWKANAPSKPGVVAAVRDSDTQVTVTISNNTGWWYVDTRVYVERKTDGGSWTQLGYVTVAANAGSSTYVDGTTDANHYYQYRARAWNTTGYSAYTEYQAKVYMTPAKPSSVSGARSGDTTTVVLTVGNSGTRNATGFDVQRRTSTSTSEGDWEAASLKSSR